MRTFRYLQYSGLGDADVEPCLWSLLFSVKLARCFCSACGAEVDSAPTISGNKKLTLCISSAALAAAPPVGAEERPQETASVDLGDVE